MGEVELGDHVRDEITGFEGVVTGYAVWLYGCKRWAVEMQGLGKEGVPVAQEWFDDGRLQLVRKAAVAVPWDRPRSMPATGGGPDPSRSGPRGD